MAKTTNITKVSSNVKLEAKKKSTSQTMIHAVIGGNKDKERLKRILTPPKCDNCKYYRSWDSLPDISDYISGHCGSQRNIYIKRDENIAPDCEYYDR